MGKKSYISMFIAILLMEMGICLAKEKVQGIQKRSLMVKDGHFYPDKMVLFENDSLHLMVGNFMGHSTCVANDGIKFFINVSPGNIVEQKINFNHLGEYKFSCPGLNADFTVVVQPKPFLSESKVMRASRTPASIPEGIWVPKSESFGDSGEW
jgi:hypothetical protein